jgi:hypothetical protein
VPVLSAGVKSSGPVVSARPRVNEGWCNGTIDNGAGPVPAADFAVAGLGCSNR